MCPCLCASGCFCVCFLAASLLDRGDCVPVGFCARAGASVLVGALDGCVSVSVAVVPYKPEHVCRGACVPVGACPGGHCRLCFRMLGRGGPGSRARQVAAPKEPQAPRSAGAHASPGCGPPGPARERAGRGGPPAPREQPGPARASPGKGRERGGRAGRGRGLAPLGLPASHWRKVVARHREGSSLKSCAHNGQRAIPGGFTSAQAGSDANGEPRATHQLSAGRAPGTATPRPLNEASGRRLAARGAAQEVRPLRRGRCAGSQCAHLPA